MTRTGHDPSHQAAASGVESPLVVMFVSHGHTLFAGAERSLLSLVQGLQAQRVRALVTVPQEGPLSSAMREVASVLIVPTPLWTPYGPFHFSGTSRVRGAYRRARVIVATLIHTISWIRVLRAVRPDVVVTNTVTTVAPALAARMLGIPHVWMIHEFVTDGHGLEYALGESWSQHVVNILSARVVANSGATARHFSRVDTAKMVIAHPPVVTREVALNDVETDHLRLLVLGQQTRPKGSTLALQVLSLVQDGAHSPIMRMVGEVSDSYRTELLALATRLGVADRLEISGPTDDPFTAIEWANVLLMCSSQETFGRVTAEALKSGRAVVASRNAGTCEVVSDGHDGFLFALGDAAGAAEAIRRLDQNRPLLRHMSDQASIRNAHRFTISEHLEIVTEAILSAAEAAPSKTRRAGKWAGL